MAILPGMAATASVRFLAILAAAYCFASVLLSAAFTALVPEPTDAHLFAHIGRQWLNGELPYVHIWDNKPPGIFAIVALAFTFLPEGFGALAAIEAFFSVASLAFVYALCRRCGLGTEAALLSTVLAAGASHLVEYTERGVLPEMYLALPAVASMYFFVASGPGLRAGYILLAGLCAGLASLFKPTGLAPLLAQIAFLGLVVFTGRVRVLRIGAAVTLLIAGAFTAWTPVMIYFMKVGGLGEMLVGSFTYNMEYGLASQPAATATFFGTVERLSPLISLVSATMLLGCLWVAWMFREGHRAREMRWGTNRLEVLTPLILAWCLVDAAGALAGGRGYGHYFVPLATSMSVAAGFVYTWVIRHSLGGLPPVRLRTATAALLLAPILAAQAGDLWLLNRDVRWGRPEDGGVTAGKYLRSISRPEHTLFVWDYLPAVYFHSALSSPVRLLHSHHMEDSPAAYERFGPIILEELREAPPTYIVHAARARGKANREDRFYSEFQQLIESDYRLIDVIPHRRISVYRRNSDP